MLEKSILSLLFTDKTGTLYPLIETSLFSHQFKDPSLKEGFSLLVNAIAFMQDWFIQTKGQPDEQDKAKYTHNACKNVYKFKTALTPAKDKDFWRPLWDYGMVLRQDKTDEEVEAFFLSLLLDAP